MKKLRLSLPGLEGAEVLTREQLKRVMGGDEGSGGGCCCEHHIANGIDWYSCGKTKSEAQAAAAQTGGKWCCDSCPANMNPCSP